MIQNMSFTQRTNKNERNIEIRKRKPLQQSQAMKKTSSIRYPFSSTIMPAVREITAKPRFWIACMLERKIETEPNRTKMFSNLTKLHKAFWFAQDFIRLISVQSKQNKKI